MNSRVTCEKCPPGHCLYRHDCTIFSLGMSSSNLPVMLPPKRTNSPPRFASTLAVLRVNASTNSVFVKTSYKSFAWHWNVSVIVNVFTSNLQPIASGCAFAKSLFSGKRFTFLLKPLVMFDTESGLIWKHNQHAQCINETGIIFHIRSNSSNVSSEKKNGDCYSP